MLSTNQKTIASTSYTNKDFESIYSELLDLVKVLTYRWDPSISNESDPGVILLKLNAVIADKCNYNSDKNVLECFPLSVTQEHNARQLFSQLGYYMRWYQSSVTNVTLKWVAKQLDFYYTIPPFTMVCNSDKSVVYTLLGPASGTTDDNFNVVDSKLPCDGQAVVFKAIQGVAINYAINGETNITPDYLGDNNRLYFDSTDIAENGIFITNTGENNYKDWVRKDNLVAEALSNTFYKFGVSSDGDYCYIEFPEDCDQIFKRGINITYIRTTGSQGNVKAKELSQFYNDLSVTGPSGESTTLNSDNVSITNPSSAATGSDPEDIDSAYRNYQRVVGTFNTLVTLRDYLNYILRSGLVSNGFVCDRTNDVQSTYKVMTLQNDINQLTTYIERHDNKLDLTAFSLKLYLLQYTDVINSYEDFSKTFNMLSSEKLASVFTYLQDVKSIQHDYVDIQPINGTRTNLCYLKNKYTLSFDIVPQYQLTQVEIDEVRASIKKALYNSLQSKNLDFGSEIGYEDVVNIIESADERIKFARLSPIYYTTYAVYFDGKDFKEIDISSDANMTEVSAPDYLSVTVNRPIFEAAVGVGDYSAHTFVYKDKKWLLNSTEVVLSDYGITVQGTAKAEDEITVQPSVSSQIREEIYAKSVLAGVTQFLVKDEDYEYSFNQSFTLDNGNKPKNIDNITKLSSNVDIVFDNYNTEYKLRDNETLQLYSPNMIDFASYGDYVKFEYYLKQPVAANASRQLLADEYVIFYWKSENAESTLYQYAMYGRGNVIQPTFALEAKTSEADIVGAVLKSELHNVGDIGNPVLQASSESDGDITLSLSQRIQSLGAKYVLSGKDKIKLRKVNEVTLDNTMYLYWVLNNNSNGKYVLFDKGTTQTEYMLNVGEYVFYTDTKQTDLAILGAGTRIKITDTSVEYSVPILDKTSVIENGTDAIAGNWFVLPKSAKFKITETYYMNISAGNVFRMVPIQTYTSWSATFNSKGVTFTGGPTQLSDFNLFYKLSDTDAKWTAIEKVDLQGYAGWESRSLLGINVADDVEQVLLSNQSLTCELLDGTSVVIHGADFKDGKYPVCLLSAYPVSLNGAQTVNTSTEINEKVYYQSFYQYGRYVTKAFPNVEYISDLSVIVTFPASKEQQEKYFDFYLPDGEYIFNLFNGYTNIDYATILLDGVELSTIANSSIKDFSAKGNYNIYMKIDNSVALPSGQDEHRITIRSKTSDGSECILTLSNPYRYTMPQHFQTMESGSILFENMKKLISMFDPDNLFDWSYVVDDSTAIPEPLSSESFLSGNHIYNAYTICQLNPIIDSDVKVVVKR